MNLMETLYSSNVGYSYIILHFVNTLLSKPYADKRELLQNIFFLDSDHEGFPYEL